MLRYTCRQVIGEITKADRVDNSSIVVRTRKGATGKHFHCLRSLRFLRDSKLRKPALLHPGLLPGLRIWHLHLYVYSLVLSPINRMSGVAYVVWLLPRGQNYVSKHTSSSTDSGSGDII